MGLFDQIRCEMPLPKGDFPEPNPLGGWFQTKDTEDPRQNNFTITSGGKLLEHPYSIGKARVEEFREVCFSGELRFNDGDNDGQWWEYAAHFAEGHCEKIVLVDYQSPKVAATVEADRAHSRPAIEPPAPARYKTRLAQRTQRMTRDIPTDPHQQAAILMQALPHMLRYDDATVVVKYGGHAMGDEARAREFAQDMVLLEQSGINPVVVHGGGPQIGAMLEKLGIKSSFANGLRVTDKATVEIVEMVLAGAINKQIVGMINSVGGRAIGLCGKDGNMVIARKAAGTVAMGAGGGETIDLGFVGEPAKVDTMVLDQVLGRELIPVLAPISMGEDGETYNVNADTFAGAIAGALRAKRLLFLTDVPGVLDADKKLIEKLSADEIRHLIAEGVITGGMIPKVQTCLYAIEQGVEGVVILDGKQPHAVLVELLTDGGAGTLITK